ncbi:MAG: hypothetical protein J0H00_07415 [Burkholderiales bacterium]|nr:hypothetical protein [Burkholderiales bacterium]
MMPQFTPRSHPARDALISISREFPGAWQAIERLRATASGGWPSFCYAPISAVYMALSEETGGHLGVDRAADVAAVAALAAWRMTQGIYRFDPAVYDALLATEDAGSIPADVLQRMPEWCVYVESPGIFDPTLGAIDGFWAHMDALAADDISLRVLTLGERGLGALTLPLGRWTIGEALQRQAEDARSAGIDARSDIAADTEVLFSKFLSLLLYICSSADEITGKRGRPGNPAPVRTRRDGWRLFPADGPRTWDVGVRMGAALRAAYRAAESGVGGDRHGPRGHVRRAHWHGFRSGPRKRADGTDIPAGERRFDLRWLPPIPVNLSDIDDLPSVIHNVR